MDLKFTDTEIQAIFDFGDTISAKFVIEHLKQMLMSLSGDEAKRFIDKIDGKRIMWVKDVEGKIKESFCISAAASVRWGTEKYETMDPAGYERTILAQYQSFRLGTKYEPMLYVWYRVTGMKLIGKIYIEHEHEHK